MRQRLLISVLLPQILVVALTCGDGHSELASVRTTLDSLEHKLEWLDYRLAQENWALLTTGTSDSLEFYRQLHDWVVADEPTFDFLRSAREQVQSGIDARRLEILYPMFLLARVEQDEQVRAARDSLATLLSSFRPELDGQPRSRAFLASQLYYDRDRSSREMAYRAANAVGDETADHLGRLFRLRNQKAQKLGYRDFFTLVFDHSELSLEEYLSLLRLVDSLTSAPFRSLTEQMRTRLSVSELEVWDLTYAYSSVFRQIDDYFPVDSQKIFIQNGLRGIGFELERLPIYMKFDNRDEGPPFVSALAIRPPHDQRVVGYWSPGLPAASAAIQEIGVAVQWASVQQSQPLFRYVRSGAWAEGMASIFADISDRDEWLRTYVHLQGELALRYRNTRQQHDLVELRLQLVQLFFEYEAYRDPNRNLDHLYWDLFEKYIGLPRHDDIKPWAATAAYVTRPVYLQDYLLGDIISAQTLAYLERYNGSVVGNTETRAFLVQNYFRFGGRFGWKGVLERGTGEPLQPKYLLERMGI